MKTYRIEVHFTAIYFDEVTIEDDQNLYEYLRSSEYEVPEDADDWTNFYLANYKEVKP